LVNVGKKLIEFTLARGKNVDKVSELRQAGGNTPFIYITKRARKNGPHSLYRSLKLAYLA